MWSATVAGCGDMKGQGPPGSSSVTVRVQPMATAVDGLQLSSGRVEIENLTVLGDVGPSQRTMVSEFSLDLTSAGKSFMLSMTPQGVYSRVRFSLDDLNVSGTWRGTPFTVQIDPEDQPAIDLLSTPIDLTPGSSAEFTVSVDPAAWFGNDLLDGATVSAGQLTIDSGHNPTVAATLGSTLPDGFSLVDSSTIQ